MLDFLFVTQLDWQKVLSFISNRDIGSLADYFEHCRGKIPFVGEIEPTNACLFKCKICPRGRGKMDRNVGYMSLDLFKKVIEQISLYGSYYEKIQELPFSSLDQFYEICGIRLHHFGDPILDPFLVERIKFIKSMTQLPVHFSTSPVYLTRDLASNILKASLDRIIFAFDAVDDRTYKEVRGTKKNLSEALKNTETFLRIKHEMSATTVVGVQLILLETNKHQVNLFKEMWQDKAVSIIIKNFAPYPDVPQDLAPQVQDQNAVSFSPSSICKRPFYSMTLLYDGRVVPCSHDYNGENIIGDINKNTINEIWHSLEFKAFRRNFIQNSFAKTSLCNRCGQYFWKNAYLKRCWQDSSFFKGL